MNLEQKQIAESFMKRQAILGAFIASYNANIQRHKGKRYNRYLHDIMPLLLFRNAFDWSKATLPMVTWFKVNDEWENLCFEYGWIPNIAKDVTRSAYRIAVDLILEGKQTDEYHRLMERLMITASAIQEGVKSGMFTSNYKEERPAMKAYITQYLKATISDSRKINNSKDLYTVQFSKNLLNEEPVLKEVQHISTYQAPQFKIVGKVNTEGINAKEQSFVKEVPIKDEILDNIVTVFDKSIFKRLEFSTNTKRRSYRLTISSQLSEELREKGKTSLSISHVVGNNNITSTYLVFSCPGINSIEPSISSLKGTKNLEYNSSSLFGKLRSYKIHPKGETCIRHQLEEAIETENYLAFKIKN